jgi:hypothetical protein
LSSPFEKASPEVAKEGIEGDFFVPFKKACPEVAKKGIEGKFSVATIV